jgi:CPA2 family monovalent cation:H+ antiporter-2
MHHNIDILITLAVCLSSALVLGYITWLLRLSPIVGYLLAGIVVGPRTAGYEADPEIANQFAELGVILLMFGVGLHFDLKDLLAVRRVAIPGSLVQILVAASLVSLAVWWCGGGWTAGVVVGLAVCIASTVVLIRVLADNNVLETEQGHIAVGWLIVQDLFTVLVLVMLPAVADALQSDDTGVLSILGSLGLAALKVGALAVIVLWGGKFVIPRILQLVARTRTRELFTLTILVIAMAIATGSALLFGVSMALGAFMAGMVVGQSEVSHQAAADALPMKDAFAVLFFVSVGMLFDASAIAEHPQLFALLLTVILVTTPLTAFSIVWLLGYSVRTGLTVAVGLAQIGEFSFILADVGLDLKLMKPHQQSLLVACAIVSIALNPLIFRGVEPVLAWLRRKPDLWRRLSQRSEARARSLPVRAVPENGDDPARQRAVVIGYGPVGRTASGILKDFGIDPVVVDLNVDTVANITSTGGLAVFGDASHRDIQEAAGIRHARYLLITIPDLSTRTAIILAARELNPQIQVLVRARYLQEREWLDEIGADVVVFEEAEAAIGLAGVLLREVGADKTRIREELRKLRNQWSMQDRPAATENQMTWSAAYMGSASRLWEATDPSDPLFNVGESDEPPAT